MKVFILKVKGNINVCQILIISLVDTMSNVEEVLELLDTVVP